MSLVMGKDFVIPFSIPEADLLAGNDIEIVSPVNGFVSRLDVIVQKAVTAGDEITVTVGEDSVIAGASVDVADAATKGTILSGTASGLTTQRVVKQGDRIRITPGADFATAGAVNGNLVINTGQ